MPIIVSKEELLKREDFFISEIKYGKIFIYPTDTVYGIGCDAENKKAINKINNIKKRENKPFSVIIPSFKWIKENCDIGEVKFLKIKKILPGAYTIILKLKNDKILSTLNNNLSTIGLRIPDSYFSEFIEKLEKPFITTSVNLSGESSVIKFSDIPKSIFNSVDYIIRDDSSLSGKCSRIIDMISEKELIIRK